MRLRDKCIEAMLPWVGDDQVQAKLVLDAVLDTLTEHAPAHLQPGEMYGARTLLAVLRETTDE